MAKKKKKKGKTKKRKKISKKRYSHKKRKKKNNRIKRSAKLGSSNKPIEKIYKVKSEWLKKALVSKNVYEKKYVFHRNIFFSNSGS